MRKPNSQSGFTIIEVMIVTMIIGVISAIVLPTVREYTARAKISEALLAFSNCRNIITDVYQSGDHSPGPHNWGCESDPALDRVSQYVLIIDTKDTPSPGTIVVTLTGFNGDPRLDLQDITLSPKDSLGNAPVIGNGLNRWRCGSPADGTTLAQKYLPGSCAGN